MEENPTIQKPHNTKTNLLKINLVFVLRFFFHCISTEVCFAIHDRMGKLEQTIISRSAELVFASWRPRVLTLCHVWTADLDIDHQSKENGGKGVPLRRTKETNAGR